MWSHARAALGAWIRYRSPTIEVRFDGVVDRGSFVLVSNTKLYGAFFVFFPQADPSDGYLDVFVFRHSGRWKFLGMVLQLVWNRWTGGAKPKSAGFLARHGVYRTKSVNLRSHGAPVQADGEVLPEGARTISVSAGALKVLLPRK